MKFKQKYKGVSRIPSGKGFSISLSEADIKNEKSASPQPSKQISYEGQGGKDYENLPKDAINPEGQGGRDYEAKDYKPKKDGMSRKASPLNKKNPHPAGTGAHKAFEERKIKRKLKNKADFDRQAGETPETATRDRSKKGWPKIKGEEKAK